MDYLIAWLSSLNVLLRLYWGLWYGYSQIYCHHKLALYLSINTRPETIFSLSTIVNKSKQGRWIPTISTKSSKNYLSIYYDSTIPCRHQIKWWFRTLTTKYFNHENLTAGNQAIDNMILWRFLATNKKKEIVPCKIRWFLKMPLKRQNIWN